jgi:hypothetical protein
MIAAPMFTIQERYTLRQLWAVLAMLDHRRAYASALERELAMWVTRHSEPADVTWGVPEPNEEVRSA